MPFKSSPAPQAPRIAGQAAWHPLQGDRPEVLLRGVGPMTFQLIQKFFYRRPHRTLWYEISAHDLTQPPTAGNTTDLASVPMLFWWLIASYGHQTRAALIHDQLYNRPSFEEVMEANLVFRDALAESEVSLLRRWIMWAGVDAAGRLKFGWARKLGVVLQFLAAFCTALATGYWAFGRFWGWWPRSSEPFGHAWIVAAVLAAGGLICWRRRYLCATLGIALVLPPLIPEIVSRSVLYGLEWAFYPFVKQGFATATPAPTVKPTFRRRRG
jgi:hypothetical protein